MLVAARLPSKWADHLLGALNPVAAIWVLKHGRDHGRPWVRMLGPGLLARLVLAGTTAQAGDLLGQADPRQAAVTLTKLPPYVAIPNLSSLERSAVSGFLEALEPKLAARLVGLSAWWVQLNVVRGTVYRKGSHGLGAMLGPPYAPTCSGKRHRTSSAGPWPRCRRPSRRVCWHICPSTRCDRSLRSRPIGRRGGWLPCHRIPQSSFYPRWTLARPLAFWPRSRPATRCGCSP